MKSQPTMNWKAMKFSTTSGIISGLSHSLGMDGVNLYVRTNLILLLFYRMIPGNVTNHE